MSDFAITAPAPTPVPDHFGRGWVATVHGEVLASQTSLPRNEIYDADHETVRLERQADVQHVVARLLPEDAMRLADQLNAAAHAAIEHRRQREEQAAQAQHIVVPG